MLSLCLFFSALCAIAQAGLHPRHSHGARRGAPTTTTITAPFVDPTSSPSSSPSPDPASGGGGGRSGSTGGGRGIIYASNAELAAFGDDIQLSTSWGPTDLGGKLGSFVPMCWGIDDKHIDSCTTASYAEGATLIGYNEPDNQGQSWMLPSTAISRWQDTVLDRAPANARIGTPGVSNSNTTALTGVGSVTGTLVNDNPQGWLWLQTFLSGAKDAGYGFDVLCWHWYGSAELTLEGNQNMLKDQAGAMVGLAQGYGIEEVWITEMGLGVEGQECEFIAWLQTTFLTDPAFSSITAYFYNQAMGTLTRGGVLTASGNA